LANSDHYLTRFLIYAHHKLTQPSAIEIVDMDDSLQVAGFIFSIVCGSLIVRRNWHTRRIQREKRVAVVGLTCLDVHAWPVHGLADTGGVSFVDSVHLSLAGTAVNCLSLLPHQTLHTFICMFDMIGRDCRYSKKAWTRD